MLRQLGPARLAIMGLVAIGLIAFFMFMSSRLGTSDMSLLFGDLTDGLGIGLTQYPHYLVLRKSALLHWLPPGARSAILSIYPWYENPRSGHYRLA